MIHSDRPIVANIVFCCFVFLDLKSGDGRTTWAKTMIPTGRDFGLVEWINKLGKKLVQVSLESSNYYLFENFSVFSDVWNNMP